VRFNLTIAALGIAVVALATTATYWRNRALHLERSVENCSPKQSSPPENEGGVGAGGQLTSLPAALPGRRGHSKKPKWKRLLAAKLKREENLQRAGDKELESAWEVIVSRALDEAIERKLGKKGVSGEKRAKLLEQLRRVRDIGELEIPLGQGEEEQRVRLLRTVALVQADQIFRNVLGMGISEFVADLSGNKQVQQISPEAIPQN